MSGARAAGRQSQHHEPPEKRCGLCLHVPCGESSHEIPSLCCGVALGFGGTLAASIPTISAIRNHNIRLSMKRTCMARRQLFCALNGCCPRRVSRVGGIILAAARRPHTAGRGCRTFRALHSLIAADATFLSTDVSTHGPCGVTMCESPVRRGAASVAF